MTGSDKRILICGGGIAGLSLALCLRRRGIASVVVERAPEPRLDGFMIDFFGPGYTAAERLGLLPDLEKIHRPIGRFAFVHRDGRERFSVAYATLRSLAGGRHFNFMRVDLERVLREQLAGQVDVRFGQSVTSIVEGPAGVSVTLSDGSVQEANLLVGADGVHSRVRELVFGEERSFLRPLGYHATAFVAENPPLHDLLGDAVDTLTVPGRQVTVYPVRDGRIAALLVHRTDAPASPDMVADELREVYGDLGWIVPRLLDGAGPHPYHDDVAQVVMPSWSRGRVVLVGDAAYAVSLLAGQGASLAMAAAAVLAEEIATRDGVEAALAGYERRLRAGVEKKQRAGRRLARYFAPSGVVHLALRDWALQLSSTRVGAWLMRRRISADELPGQGH